jgi:hypothetical protein
MCYTAFVHGANVGPIMSVHFVFSYQWEDSGEKSDVEDLLHQVRSLDGKSLLVQVMVLEGNLIWPFRIICPVPGGYL